MKNNLYFYYYIKRNILKNLYLYFLFLNNNQYESVGKKFFSPINMAIAQIFDIYKIIYINIINEW